MNRFLHLYSGCPPPSLLSVVDASSSTRRRPFVVDLLWWELIEPTGRRNTKIRITTGSGAIEEEDSCTRCSLLLLRRVVCCPVSVFCQPTTQHNISYMLLILRVHFFFPGLLLLLLNHEPHVKLFLKYSKVLASSTKEKKKKKCL